MNVDASAVGAVSASAAPPMRSARAARWTRAAAVLAALGYLAILLGGWAANAPRGHDGVLRPPPHELLRRVPSFAVLEVEPGSPADRAGLRPGDAIAAVDGVPVRDGVHQPYHDRRAGDRGSLTVHRRGDPAREERLELALESRVRIRGVAFGLAVATLVGVMVMAVGAAVAFLRPHLPAARLLLVFAAGLALQAASDLWHWAQVEAQRGDAVDEVASAAMVLGSVALLQLFATFPTPNALARRLGRVGPARLAPLGRLGGGFLLLYALPPALLLLSLAGILSDGWTAFTLLQMALLLGALGCLLWRYRGPTTPLARAQLTWIGWGLAVAVAATALRAGAALLFGDVLPALFDVGLAAAWLLVPISLGLAVLRYRLFDVDRVVRRRSPGACSRPCCWRDTARSRSPAAPRGVLFGPEAPRIPPSRSWPPSRWRRRRTRSGCA